MNDMWAFKMITVKLDTNIMQNEALILITIMIALQKIYI
jgi:hypothetical protein